MTRDAQPEIVADMWQAGAAEGRSSQISAFFLAARAMRPDRPFFPQKATCARRITSRATAT